MTAAREGARRRRAARQVVLATAPALALWACTAGPPPAPRELGITPPERWSAAEAGEAPVGVPDVDRPWWSAFGDAELDRLVELALAANRDLAATAARVEAAAAQARIAGAASLPQAGLGVDAGRRRQNFIGLPIPGGEGGVLSSTSTTYGGALTLSWEADLWGRLAAGESAAEAELSATRADLAGARLSLAGQTAKAWFAAVEGAGQVALAERTLDARRLTRDQIRRRFEAGLRSALDLRLAIANHSAAEAALAGRRRQLDASVRRLELLLSRYPGAELADRIAGRSLPAPPPAPPAGLPAELVTRRPDLAAAERRLEAAGLGIRQARAALYPRLSLTGSAGRLSGEVEDLLDSDFSVWSLASSLLQPLFQGGRLRAAVDLAEARYEELAERYAQTVLRAFGEVELALSAAGHLAAQAEALAVAAEQSAAAERQAEDRYRAGLAPYLAVLEAQRQAADTASRLIETRRLLLDARVDLHLALGGGWSERAAEAGAARVTLARGGHREVTQ